MVGCNGCNRRCKKVSVDGATVKEFEAEMVNHSCSFPENKNFVPDFGIKKELSCSFKLARNGRGEVLV